MAERNLAGEPNQDVEPDADHGGQRDQGQDEVRVAAGEERKGDARTGQRQDRERHREAHRQTLLTAARPSSPFGISVSATITTENTTICV